MPDPENTTTTECAHCGTERTEVEVAALPLATKNGGTMRYGAETHEYRICPCGMHILTVRREVRPARPSSRPSFSPTPMMEATTHANRRR